MENAEIIITKAEFVSSNYEEVIKDVSPVRCESCFQPFYKEAKIAKEKGDFTRQKVFSMLGDATSLYFRLDSLDEPLSPMAIFSNGRSASITDFSDADISVFSEWVHDITIPEIKARISDIIFLRTGNYKFGVDAVDAYIDTCNRDISDELEWPHKNNRIERALQIATLLGKKGPSYTKVIEYINKTITDIGDFCESHFGLKLMELLKKRKEGNPSQLVLFSESSAQHAESKGIWQLATEYWEFVGYWYSIIGNLNDEKSAKIKAADCYISQKEEALTSSPPNFMIAAMHLQQAIQAYRRIGGLQEKVNSLQKEMIEVQSNIASQMKEFSIPLDVSEYAQKAQKAVSGKSFRESITYLALCINSPQKNILKQQAEKNIKDFPLMHLIRQTRVNDDGKVIGQRDGMNLDERENGREIIESEMYSQAHIQNEVSTASVIRPMLDQINIDHPEIRESDFYFFTLDNPFIPIGRDVIFTKGLFAGYKGDYLIALSLLIPQLENSIRMILNLHGELTSGLDDSGLQMEFQLGKLLSLPKIIDILGEDLVFNLKGLLTETMESNYRNRFAHGLMDFEDFSSYSAIYIWWVVLHICVRFYLANNPS